MDMELELKKARRDLALHEKWRKDAPQRAERVRVGALSEAEAALQEPIRRGFASYERFLNILSEMRVLAGRIENDFKERAFAPFWDGICGFAVKMGRLDTEMRLIAQFYRVYKEKYALYSRIHHHGDPDPPCFGDEMLNPIEPVALKEITDWFYKMMRGGQKDFQFASVYEHYRTREVLVDGFGDLVQKFTDVSGVLSSINRSLIKGFQELGASVGGLRGAMTDEFGYLRECIEEQQKKTRRVIKRVEAQAQERHEGLIECYEHEQEMTRETMEEMEDRKRERQRELLATYEYEQEAIRETLTAGLDRDEARQQDRHEEVISEGKRDRELIKDIDRQIGGKEWYRS